MGAPIRDPAVAGRFYPADPEALRENVRSYLNIPEKKIQAIGCVVPHAGYMYSGHVAGAVYSRLKLPRKIVILCPNHTGIGEPLAIMSQGAWLTPLGEAKIDHQLAGELKDRFPYLSEDAAAHAAEHALEVQLPFLQALEPEFSFVPIAIGVGRYEMLAALGEALARVIASQSEPILIIASSDMNHYEPDAITRIKDDKAIQKVLALEPRSLFDVVTKEKISMCGFGPTVAMLTAAKRLGARSAELIEYATSGDVSGERDMVVGYAGIAVM